eukprot:m.103856 g.103856  ORF g.103856 m.103856 type:complete len:303 (-) comp13247_c0_seq7:124-1032(-)
MKQVLFSTCDVLPVQIASGLQIHSCLTKRFYLRCAAVFACSRAVELFYGVRDVLDLFRSIAPTKLKKPDPYHSAILHNDCFYIAHHLLCLGYRYKASLPEDLQAIATFVDLVPAFRQLGEQALMTMVAEQHSLLREKMETMHGLRECHLPERFNEIRGVLDSCLESAQELGRAWDKTLPSTVFNMTLGSVVTVIMAGLVHEVLSLQDIAERDADGIHELLSIVSEAVPKLWQVELTPTELAEHLPCWTRFHQVRELMVTRLVDIGEKHQDQYWVLKSDELRSMVKALFTNTDMRAEIIAIIA